MSELPHAVEQAIEWYARRCSGQFDETDQFHFQHWLETDPSHAAAWDNLQRRLRQTLPTLGQPAVRQLLQSPRIDRRTLLRGALALGGLGIGAHLLGQPGMLLTGWNADLKTSTAERRPYPLPDGSELLLNAETCADLDFSATARRVTLLRGGLIAKVQAGKTPFSLLCHHGEAQLATGRYLLELRADAAYLWSLAGDARLFPQASAQLRLSVGQGAEFNADGVHILTAPTADPAAWSRGLLEVQDQPLASVIDSLRPYHPGILQVAGNVAGLRISGVFNLDDSEQALQALAEILPLRIERYLGWWTRIEHA